jgi:hypothetical protein
MALDRRDLVRQSLSRRQGRSYCRWPLSSFCQCFVAPDLASHLAVLSSAYNRAGLRDRRNPATDSVTKAKPERTTAWSLRANHETMSSSLRLSSNSFEVGTLHSCCSSFGPCLAFRAGRACYTGWDRSCNLALKMVDGRKWDSAAAGNFRSSNWAATSACSLDAGSWEADRTSSG